MEEKDCEMGQCGRPNIRRPSILLEEAFLGCFQGALGIKIRTEHRNTVCKFLLQGLGIQIPQPEPESCKNRTVPNFWPYFYSLSMTCDFSPVIRKPLFLKIEEIFSYLGVLSKFEVLFKWSHSSSCPSFQQGWGGRWRSSSSFHGGYMFIASFNLDQRKLKLNKPRHNEWILLWWKCLSLNGGCYKTLSGRNRASGKLREAGPRQQTGGFHYRAEQRRRTHKQTSLCLSSRSQRPLRISQRWQWVYHCDQRLAPLSCICLLFPFDRFKGWTRTMLSPSSCFFLAPAVLQSLRCRNTCSEQRHCLSHPWWQWTQGRSASHAGSLASLWVC